MDNSLLAVRDINHKYIVVERRFAMKQYEYVSVHIGKLFGAASEEHREIINDYAAKGWRYVGFIPTNMNDYGKLKDIDLIFEKDC